MKLRPLLSGMLNFVLAKKLVAVPSFCITFPSAVMIFTGSYTALLLSTDATPGEGRGIPVTSLSGLSGTGKTSCHVRIKNYVTSATSTGFYVGFDNFSVVKNRIIYNIAQGVSNRMAGLSEIAVRATVLKITIWWNSVNRPFKSLLFLREVQRGLSDWVIGPSQTTIFK